MSNASLDAALHQVPFLATLGVSVEQARPGRVVLRLPYQHSSTTSDGSLHNAVIFGVAELAALVVVATHPELHAYRVELLTSSVVYQARAHRDVTAHAELVPEQRAALLEELHHLGRGQTEMRVSVMDGHAVDVAEVAVWLRLTP